MRMLLDHTSGFPNWRRFMDDKKLRIYFALGSKFAYSGEGIGLAQMVVETITQRSVNDLMNQRIFQPLSMSRTSMGGRSDLRMIMQMHTTKRADR